MMPESDLKELLDMVPPPANPVGALGDWNAIEKTIGIELPSDFKLLVSIYGGGAFCGIIYLSSPFVPGDGWNLPDSDSHGFLNQMSIQLTNLRSYRSEGIGIWKEEQYPIYPEPGGLLPFAGADSGPIYSWRIQGHPGEWPIFVWDPSDLQIYAVGFHSFVSFLVNIFKKKVFHLPTSDPLDYDCFDSPYFTPDTDFWR